MNKILGLPRVTLTADGTPLSAEDVRALGEVRVQQRLSLPTLFELTFRDPPGSLTRVLGLVPGTRLQGGVEGQTESLFDGEVTAVEHVYGLTSGHEIRVRGYDLLHRLRKRQTLRAYVQVNLLEFAQELIVDLGLAVQGDQTGPLWQRLIQYRQSDFDLLAEAAGQCGLYFYLKDNVLRLLTLDGMGSPVSLTLGDSLLEARIELNGDSVCGEVEVAGWYPLDVKTHEGHASQARVGRSIIAEVTPGQVGAGNNRTVLNWPVQDDDHASALAQAELDTRVAKEAALWGTAAGDTSLYPGVPVEISGVAETLTGTYILTAVTHIINERVGFVSEISSYPPAPFVRETTTIIAYALVTRVDDPDNLGRIKVSLPTYGKVETEWMGVLSPGAGGHKGLVTSPDVGDQVLVLFANGDPTQGIVLGGLYGTGGPPDSGVESGAVRRYTLVTPGGQRIRLDDAQKIIQLEDSNGSYVKLAPDKLSIHAVSDLQIEAPGKAIIIRGNSIDFERA